jgi:hypothetical protein
MGFHKPTRHRVPSPEGPGTVSSHFTPSVVLGMFTVHPCHIQKSKLSPDPKPPVPVRGQCPRTVSPAASGTWPGAHCSAPAGRTEDSGQIREQGHLFPGPPPHHRLPYLVPILGQMGPDGFDLVVEDVVLFHLAVHQWQVCPKALATQLVLG